MTRKTKKSDDGIDAPLATGQGASVATLDAPAQESAAVAPRGLDALQAFDATKGTGAQAKLQEIVSAYARGEDVAPEHAQDVMRKTGATVAQVSAQVEMKQRKDAHVATCARNKLRPDVSVLYAACPGPMRSRHEKAATAHSDALERFRRAQKVDAAAMRRNVEIGEALAAQLVDVMREAGGEFTQHRGWRFPVAGARWVHAPLVRSGRIDREDAPGHLKQILTTLGRHKAELADAENLAGLKQAVDDAVRERDAALAAMVAF